MISSLARRYSLSRDVIGPGFTARMGRSKVNELLPESVQFLGGKCAEERLQDDGRLAHARIQIIAKDFQLLPGSVRQVRGPVGNAGEDFPCLFMQVFDDFAERIKFMEKAGTFPEKDLRQDAVHHGNSLSARAAKVRRGQRFYVWNGPKMGAVVPECANHVVDANRQAIEKAPDDRSPLLGGLKTPPIAKGNGLIERNAQNDGGRFQVRAGGIEKLVHFVGDPGKPILSDRA